MRFVKELVARNGNGSAEKNVNGHRGPLFNPNPYLNARKGWNSQIDRAFSHQHVWQFIALISLLIAFASVSGIVYIGSKAKFVPYVIEVDKLGDTVAVGPAQIAAPADPRVIRASLAAWVEHARLVTPDQDLQRKAIFGVYGMLKTKDPATVKMNEFLDGTPQSSPFSRAAKMTVSTEIQTILQVTEHSWSVDWIETMRDRDGGLLGKPVAMRAVLQTYIEPPPADSRQADIQRNPLGVWVRDYTWQSL